MTPEEFKRQMEKIDMIADPETKHQKADDLMSKVLEDEGYGDGIQVYENMSKWYS